MGALRDTGNEVLAAQRLGTCQLLGAYPCTSVRPPTSKAGLPAEDVLHGQGIVPAALVLKDVQLRQEVVAAGHCVDAVWLSNAAVNVQQQLLVAGQATLQVSTYWVTCRMCALDTALDTALQRLPGQDACPGVQK